jgi:hypothetical protein
MRAPVLFGLAALVAVALSTGARPAEAGYAARAVEEARAALFADAPQRDAARSALRRAIAAADDASAVAEAHFRLGALDEEDALFESALSSYRDCLRVAQAGVGTRWARNAGARIQWLSARSEGSFAPLARLYRIRRDPASAVDPDAIAGFARDAEAFPPGTVRAEARLLVATAWLGPLQRPEDGIVLLRRVTSDASADGTSLRTAERTLVDALLAAGRLDEAAKEARLHTAQLDPQVVARVEELMRRRALRWGGSFGVPAVAALAAALALARRGKARAAGSVGIEPGRPS